MIIIKSLKLIKKALVLKLKPKELLEKKGLWIFLSVVG